MQGPILIKSTFLCRSPKRFSCPKKAPLTKTFPRDLGALRHMKCHSTQLKISPEFVVAATFSKSGCDCSEVHPSLIESCNVWRISCAPLRAPTASLGMVIISKMMAKVFLTRSACYDVNHKIEHGVIASLPQQKKSNHVLCVDIIMYLLFKS